MRNVNLVAAALLSAWGFASVGCGGGNDYGVVPVSGTVTFDGKPVGKLRISFLPLPVGENYETGPYSTGETDSEGKFTLKTRYGNDGAVAGRHSLRFVYSDVSKRQMDDLRYAMGEAREEGSKADYEKAKKKLAELKAKLKGRPVLKFRYREVVEVPAEGIDDLKLELSKIK